VNGRPIASATLLADGDEIRIGAITAVFRSTSEASATMSLPPERG
jgi:pSer/pThr/pTyr-binding forkhead associated (FHA) protein